MIMVKKTTRNIWILVLVSSLSALSVMGFATVSHKYPQSNMNMLIETFLKGDVSKIESYYYSWGSLTDIISEEKLIKGRYDYKITVKLASVSYLLKLQKIADTFNPEKINVDKTLDCRLAFCFFNKDSEIFRVSFVKNAPVMLINGEAYKVSTQLLTILLPMLPYDAYEDFQAMMLENWSYSTVK